MISNKCQHKILLFLLVACWRLSLMFGISTVSLFVALCFPCSSARFTRYMISTTWVKRVSRNCISQLWLDEELRVSLLLSFVRAKPMFQQTRWDVRTHWGWEEQKTSYKTWIASISGLGSTFSGMLWFPWVYIQQEIGCVDSKLMPMRTILCSGCMKRSRLG